jgi:hypothetical protein
MQSWPARSAGPPVDERDSKSKELPALFYIGNEVLRLDAKYSSSQRLIALAIAARMGRKENGKDVAFMGLQDLAERTKLSVSTVKRHIRRLCEGEYALFARRLGGVTRGHTHDCYSYELLRRANGRAHGELKGTAR